MLCVWVVFVWVCGVFVCVCVCVWCVCVCVVCVCFVCGCVFVCVCVCGVFVCVWCVSVCGVFVSVCVCVCVTGHSVSVLPEGRRHEAGLAAEGQHQQQPVCLHEGESASPWVTQHVHSQNDSPFTLSTPTTTPDLPYHRETADLLSRDHATIHLAQLQVIRL